MRKGSTRSAGPLAHNQPRGSGGDWDNAQMGPAGACEKATVGERDTLVTKKMEKGKKSS
jgi:hypothetical protein